MLHTLPRSKVTELVLNKFLKDNPALKLGDWMKGPIGVAVNGRLLTEDEIDDVNQKHVLEARTIHIPYDERGNLPSLELSVGGYLHPYSVCCMVSPGQPDHINATMDWAGNVLGGRIGDLAVVMNSMTFELEQKPITAEMQDKLRKVMIRFAISGQFRRDEQASFE